MGRRIDEAEMTGSSRWTPDDDGEDRLDHSMVEVWSDGTPRSLIDHGDAVPSDLRELPDDRAALFSDVFRAAADELAGEAPFDTEGFRVRTFGSGTDRWLRVETGRGVRVDVEWDGSVGDAIVTLVSTARQMVEDLED